MTEEWLTYQELGERLGVSPEAARQKAIRGHWPRRTANDGKAQVRVDVEDVRASTPVRKPKDDQSSDEPSPPVEQVSDTQAFAALEAHIETLKAMVARAEAMTTLERERADKEQVRADRERDRADAERTRANKVYDDLVDANKAASENIDALKRQIEEINNRMSLRRRPWWHRLAG